MTEYPNNRIASEGDDTLSSTGGLPPDFFDVQESPPPDGPAQALPARVPLTPSRLVGETASPRVVIEQRISLPLVLAVLAGNTLFFLGGGLAGWAAARKVGARVELAPIAAMIPPVREVVREIDAGASKSVVDALTSRIGELQLQFDTTRREVAQLEGRLNARINAPPSSSIAPAPPDLAPLRTRIDDLVKRSQNLSPLPAAVESLRQRADALDKGLEKLRTQVAAVPKEIDKSLNALKGAIESRPAPVHVTPAGLYRELGAALFRDGKYPAAREVFLMLVQNYPDDARLWYFAALANGLASGDWASESEALVRRGLACEQKGWPGRSEIDNQFSTLTKEQGKDWLADWRNRASR